MNIAPISRINVIYCNDIHGENRNIDSFLEARNKFYKNNKGANLTLCGGDVFLGTSSTNDTIARKLIPSMDAIAIGNQDIATGLDYLLNMVKKFDLSKKFLSINLSSAKADNLVPESKIIEKNGEKIGIIGISPFDCMGYISNKDIDILNLEKTAKLVKEKVKELEDKGINKIFLLAHTGAKSEDEEYYKRLAQIGGVDVIIGGHDHLEYDEFDTTERGEPVKIVATGESKEHGFNKELDYFGELNLEFDNNGVLIKENCSNTFKQIVSNGMQDAPDETEIIFTIKEPLTKTDTYRGHSEIGNLIADSNLWYVNQHTKGKPADFSFVNPGCIRSNLNKTDVTEEKINKTLPYNTSTLIKAPLTKGEIITTLNTCAKSTLEDDCNLGTMQVSGMKYTISPDLTVKNVCILNSDGTVKYNLDDFDDYDEFVCVYDTFLSSGAHGLECLKKSDNDKNIEYFSATRQDAIKEYFKKDNVKNYKDTRINIENI